MFKGLEIFPELTLSDKQIDELNVIIATQVESLATDLEIDYNETIDYFVDKANKSKTYRELNIYLLGIKHLYQKLDLKK